MLTDSHCHLDSRKFDSDRAEVIERARASLRYAVTIGMFEGAGTVERALALADANEFVYASVGVHPHEAKLPADADFAHLEQLARHKKVVGWGEIGLDFHYDFSPRDVQRKVFLKQLEIARGLKLPIIIHCRDTQNTTNAWDETITLLEQHWGSSGLGGVLHCFSGNRTHARRAVDLGFATSFAGTVTFPKADELRLVAQELPLESILVETDSPYLAPVPHRGKRNEPALVEHTARAIAALRGMELEEFAAATTRNFERMFLSGR